MENLFNIVWENEMDTKYIVDIDGRSFGATGQKIIDMFKCEYLERLVAYDMSTVEFDGIKTTVVLVKEAI